MSTVSTVGYGDYVPVSLGGRLTSALLMLVGIGIFSVMSGYLANAFITPRGRLLPKNQQEGQAGDLNRLETELTALRLQLEQIHPDLARLVRDADKDQPH